MDSGRILEGKEHIAMSINYKGKSEMRNILGVLATLVSHRIPVDLSVLGGERREVGSGVLNKKAGLKGTLVGREKGRKRSDSCCRKLLWEEIEFLMCW